MVLDVQWVCSTGFFLASFDVLGTVKVEVRRTYLCEINVTIDNFIIL